MTATAGTGQINLSWTSSTSATSYDVLRSTTSGGPYTQTGTSNTTSYVDISVTSGTTYYYVVTAVNSSGQSGDSNQASATIGFVIGVALAFVAARIERAALFGVSALDALSIAAAFSTLAIAMIAAAWLPARRAASIEPMEALRCE